jgi:hypothetical protein
MKEAIIYIPPIDLRVISTFWTFFLGDLFYRKFRFQKNSINRYPGRVVIYQVDINSIEFPVIPNYHYHFVQPNFCHEQVYFQQNQQLYAEEHQQLYAEEHQQLYAEEHQQLYAEEHQQLYDGEHQQLYNGEKEENSSILSDLTTVESLENKLFEKEEILMKEFQSNECKQICQEKLLFEKEELLMKEFQSNECKQICQEKLLFEKEEFLMREFQSNECKQISQEKLLFEKEEFLMKNFLKFELIKASKEKAILEKNAKMEMKRIQYEEKKFREIMKAIEEQKIVEKNIALEEEKKRLEKIAAQKEREILEKNKAERDRQAKIAEKEKKQKLKKEAEKKQKEDKLAEEEALEGAIKLAKFEKEKSLEAAIKLAAIEKEKEVSIKKSKIEKVKMEAIKNMSPENYFHGIKEDTSKFMITNQKIFMINFFNKFGLNKDYLCPINTIKRTPENDILWHAYDECTYILSKVINLVILVHLKNNELAMIKQHLVKIYYYIIENIVISTLQVETKKLLGIINTVQLMRYELVRDENPYFQYLSFIYIIYARCYMFVSQKNDNIEELNQAICELGYLIHNKIFNEDNTLNKEIMTNEHYSDKIFEELFLEAQSYEANS